MSVDGVNGWPVPRLDTTVTATKPDDKMSRFAQGDIGADVGWAIGLLDEHLAHRHRINPEILALPGNQVDAPPFWPLTELT